MAVVFSLWSFTGDSPVAHALAAGVIVLSAVRLCISNKAQAADRNNDIRSLRRLATSHWRIGFDHQVCDGWLRRVWYGWGWVTLSIQPYAQAKPITITIWRVNVSSAAWHQLRVWTAWELAMIEPPALTEVRQ